MELNSFLTSPATSLAYAERYINDGSPSGFTDRYRTSAGTDPFGPDPHFYLYGIRVPPAVIEDFGVAANAPPGVFLIHPDMRSHPELSQVNSSRWPDFAVVPTASARTVQICTPELGDYIKLHYDNIIGRINRSLPRRKAVNGPELSAELLAAIMAGTLPHRFALLHEPMARFLSYPDNRNSADNWSLVWRERLPRGREVHRIRCMLPLFALWSRDRTDPNHVPLIRQLCARWGKNSRPFLRTCIIYVLVDSYFSMIVRLGLQFELNAQNILIGLDDRAEPVSVVVRDCMGIEKDIDIRRRLGLSITFAAQDYKTIGSEIDATLYRIRHSFAFDFKFSRYVIDPLIRVADEMGVWPREAAIRDVRSCVNRWVGQLPPDYFPGDNVWFRHDNELLVSERRYIEVASPLLR